MNTLNDVLANRQMCAKVVQSAECSKQGERGAVREVEDTIKQFIEKVKKDKLVGAWTACVRTHLVDSATV